VTLNLGFHREEKKDRADSPQTMSLTEGFEMQDTVGGKDNGKGRSMKLLRLGIAVIAKWIASSLGSRSRSSMCEDDLTTINAKSVTEGMRGVNKCTCTKIA
jgi:hypothetical protein